MPDIEIIEEVSQTIKVRMPGLYKVVLHNDNTTTFDFVIQVLVTIFHRTPADSIDVVKAIHVDGVGIAGSPYTREIAEEKVRETISYSRANKFPLVATYEEL